MELKNDIQNVDGLIIAVNEHNSAPSAFFKNLIDWLSRIDRKFLIEKKVFLMSASPGARGGATSLEIVKGILPRFGATVTATFSLPAFNDNFSSASGITDKALAEAHQLALTAFVNSL